MAYQNYKIMEFILKCKSPENCKSVSEFLLNRELFGVSCELSKCYRKKCNYIGLYKKFSAQELSKYQSDQYADAIHAETIHADQVLNDELYNELNDAYNTYACFDHKTASHYNIFKVGDLKTCSYNYCKNKIVNIIGCAEHINLIGAQMLYSEVQKIRTEPRNKPQENLTPDQEMEIVNSYLN